MITNAALREAFLSPQMAYYFRSKLAPLAPAEVDLRIEEALKFLNLTPFNPGDIPVSREIDEVWHYWVLETAEYQKLCRKLPGGNFLHHSSNDYAEFENPNAKEGAIDMAAQLAFLGAYVKNFGPFEPDRVRYWVFAQRLMDLLGWSLDELNARLLACASPAEHEATAEDAAPA